MPTPTLQNYVADRWFTAAGGFAPIPSALDGETVAQISAAGLDFAAMTDYARKTGGPASHIP